jgi:hypothetical protein
VSWNLENNRIGRSALVRTGEFAVDEHSTKSDEWKEVNKYKESWRDIAQLKHE